MNAIQVEISPWLGKKHLLHRRLLTRKLYLGPETTDIVGFHIDNQELIPQLTALQLFYAASHMLDDELPTTNGEQALKCPTCPAYTEDSLRPFLTDEGKLLCLGLAASNRRSNQQLSCLKSLRNRRSMIVEIPLEKE